MAWHMVFPGKGPISTGEECLIFLLGVIVYICLFGWVGLFCFGVGLFDFILYGICWSSWMFILMYFIKYGKLLVVISASILSLFWNSHNKHVLIYLMVSRSSLRLFSSVCFLSVLRFSAFYCYIFKFADYFFSLLKSAFTFF